jgi:hypothetical protein
VAVAQTATVIVVAGAPVDAEFAGDLKLQVEAWAKVSAEAKAKHVAIGAAYKGERSLDHYFVLVREDV